MSIDLTNVLEMFEDELNELSEHEREEIINEIKCIVQDINYIRPEELKKIRELIVMKYWSAF